MFHLYNAVLRGAAGPGGWDPVSPDGAVRHAAIGLFAPTAGLVPTQATVEKHRANPLFGQDRPWETRIDNGYPNVVYDPSAPDGPWRLWYGNIGDGGQYLLFANSSDGLGWGKPDLGRYDLAHRWPKLRAIGTRNNIVMFGGGLGVYRDVHETNASRRYKISGGAPAGCYDATGDTDCVVGTAASPDGIGDWTDVQPLGFPAPWRPDCHTNLIWDEPLGQYIMTTRDYENPDGRLISIARTGGKGRSVFEKNGSWSVLYRDAYPDAQGIGSCFKLSAGRAEEQCAAACLKTPSCRFFWTYTEGKDAGNCCLKSSILGKKLLKPACPDCGGLFVVMGGKEVRVNSTQFDAWEPPVIVERGTAAHQLYSQITWRFYDIFLGVVMTFDAEDKAGHVHCMLSWSPDSKIWHWVDPAGLEALKEFIPQGPAGSFDSHVCFAAHLPLRMPEDGSTRLYYMGGDGPHSGARNSSFALATLPPDRFAGMAATGPAPVKAVASSRVNVTGSVLTVTADVAEGGSLSVGLEGAPDFARSLPITKTGTDLALSFAGQPSGLRSLIGTEQTLVLYAKGATLHTVGFQ